MCGIAGFVLNPKSRKMFPVTKFSEALWAGIEKRGEDATGFVSTGVNQKTGKAEIVFRRSAVKASDFIKTYRVPGSATAVLLHTRHATQGKPEVQENNHPVNWHTCFVTHNGHINNDDALIKDTIGEDKRVGEVDSFAIPAVLDFHGWGDEADIKKSLESLEGGFAIAAIDPIQMPGKVLLAKGDTSPLFTLTTPQGIFWASSEECIKEAWGATLGTPPAGIANKIGDIGYKTMWPGDWWRINVQDNEMKILSGRFNVNRYTPATSVTHYHRPYTPNDREWTCWPNEKNCVFGADCGNCWNDHCTCYEGNETHPRMNDDTTYKEAIAKWVNFKHHCGKYKLTEEMISPNPTQTSLTEKTASSTAAVSSPPRMPFTSPRGSGFSASEVTKCFFCQKMFDKGTMRTICLVGRMKEELFKCKNCDAKKDAAEARGSEDQGGVIDPKIAAVIAKLEPTCKIALDMVDKAITEAAWTYKLDVDFCRWLVQHKPEDPADGDFHLFHKSVKQCVRDCMKVYNEMRRMEVTR